MGADRRITLSKKLLLNQTSKFGIACGRQFNSFISAIIEISVVCNKRCLNFVLLMFKIKLVNNTN